MSVQALVGTALNTRIGSTTCWPVCDGLCTLLAIVCALGLACIYQTPIRKHKLQTWHPTFNEWEYKYDLARNPYLPPLWAQLVYFAKNCCGVNSSDLCECQSLCRRCDSYGCCMCHLTSVAEIFLELRLVPARTRNLDFMSCKQ